MSTTTLEYRLTVALDAAEQKAGLDAADSALVRQGQQLLARLWSVSTPSPRSQEILAWIKAAGVSA